MQRTIHDIASLRISSSPVIDLSNNNISHLNGLPAPQIIQKLIVAQNQISKIEEEPFRYCKLLSYLDLSSNNIEKIENLFRQENLHHLFLSHNKIGALENLEGNTKLRQLDLSDNQINMIYIRSPLQNLVYLNLDRNRLRRITGIENFPCLSNLSIEENSISSINLIRSLVNLRKLNVAENCIVDFEPFFHPLLAQANFASNRLTSLSSFASFQHLVSLDISMNAIDDSGLVGYLPKLKMFYANQTNISRPSQILKVAPNLVHLCVSFCKISSIEECIAVAEHPSIQYIDFRGNPVNSTLYPDVDPKQFSVLAEYDSEEEYDSQYPENSELRHQYRERIIGDGNILWLDGIRAAEIAIPPSMLVFPELEEQPINDDSYSQTIDPQINEASVQCEYNTRIDIGQQTSHAHLPAEELPEYDDDEEESVNECSSCCEFRPQVQDIELNSINFCSDDDDKYSANTDASSEIFCPIDVKPSSSRRQKQEPILTDGGITKTQGGCAFWVDFQPEKPAPRVKPSNIKKPSYQHEPFRKNPTNPARPSTKNSDYGHWPFNAKVPRRLPWDNEPEPPYQKPKRKLRASKRTTK